MSAEKRPKVLLEQLVVRVPTELRAELGARAEAEDRPLAQVVRRALRFYFDHTEAS